MALGMEVGLDPGHIVLDGDPASLPKRGQSPPNFRPLRMDVGLSPGDFVLHGDPASPLKGHSPQFLAIVRCGQTAGWNKMPLGMEAGLSPGDFVFDGDPATP